MLCYGLPYFDVTIRAGYAKKQWPRAVRFVVDGCAWNGEVAGGWAPGSGGISGHGESWNDTGYNGSSEDD